eukprot:7759596-Pyramimonas_sp.AAC.1
MRAGSAGEQQAPACSPAPTGSQIANAWATARAYAGRQRPWAQLKKHPFPDDVAEQLRREEALQGPQYVPQSAGVPSPTRTSAGDAHACLGTGTTRAQRSSRSQVSTQDPRTKKPL